MQSPVGRSVGSSIGLRRGRITAPNAAAVWWDRAEESPLVLPTVVATRGSTYRKPGAQMLIAPNGQYESC